MPDAQNRGSGAIAHRFAPAAPDEEYVYGACAPGWHSAAGHDAALEDWIGFMRARDVERVCCLLPGDRDDPPGALDAFADAFGAHRVLHAPVADNRLVGPGLLDREVLPFLDDAVDADERVVVHCLSGICRTGQVLAAWLAHDRGYDPDHAVETVVETGRQPREAVSGGSATERELHDLLAAFA